MAAPWQYGPKVFDVPAGESSLVQLNVPFRGTIKSFSLRAPGGAGGTFEIYSNEAAARAAVADGNGSSESVGAGDIPAANYNIYSGTLSSGQFIDQEMETPYFNRDGSLSLPEGRLWMRLTPDGSGELHFGVSMLIEGVFTR